MQEVAFCVVFYPRLPSPNQNFSLKIVAHTSMLMPLRYRGGYNNSEQENHSHIVRYVRLHTHTHPTFTPLAHTVVNCNWEPPIGLLQYHYCKQLIIDPTNLWQQILHWGAPDQRRLYFLLLYSYVKYSASDTPQSSLHLQHIKFCFIYFTAMM